MSNPVLIINGPNLNMLGSRQVEIYGKDTLADIKALCESHAQALSLKCEFWQSNNEGEIVGWVQQAPTAYKGIIINAAAYTHTSLAIMDALLSIDLPVVEVHLSNLFKREEARHHSYVSQAVRGMICGFGAHGYVLALYALAKMLEKN